MLTNEQKKDLALKINKQLYNEVLGMGGNINDIIEMAFGICVGIFMGTVTVRNNDKLPSHSIAMGEFQRQMLDKFELIYQLALADDELTDKIKDHASKIH